MATRKSAPAKRRAPNRRTTKPPDSSGAKRVRLHLDSKRIVRLRKRLKSVFVDCLKALIRGDALIGGVREERVYEGTAIERRTPDGTVKIEPKPTEVGKVIINLRDIEDTKLSVVLDGFFTMVNGYRKALLEKMFTTIGEATRGTDRDIEVKGPPSFEHFLAALENLKFSLNEATGELEMPTMVAHPSMERAILQALESAEHDPSQLERLEDLKKRKRREAIAEENSRKLS